MGFDLTNTDTVVVLIVGVALLISYVFEGGVDFNLSIIYVLLIVILSMHNRIKKLEKNK